MGKAVYFLSDAHLTFHSKDTEKTLADFLTVIAHNATHIYIVGDLFDFWLEYRHAIPATYLRTLATLLSLTDQGIEVIYLPGNHDFWMIDYLQREASVKLAGPTLNVLHQGKRIHLFHGDGLAHGDGGYRLLKKIFRWPPNIWLYRLLPVDLAYWLALRSSAASRQFKRGKYHDEAGYREYARAKLAGGFDAVIMGHTHRPLIEKIGDGTYINLGDWLTHFSYAVLQDGLFALEFYSQKSPTSEKQLDRN